MKLRLTGTHAEITAVLPALAEVLDVLEVSDFYPNRGATRLGRVYLEIAGPRPDRVRAETTRTERPDTGIRRGNPALEPGRRGESQ